MDDAPVCACTGGPTLPMGQNLCYCQVRALIGLGVLPKALGLVPMAEAMIRFTPPPRPPDPPSGDAMRTEQV
jgi:hypothetical protein